MRRAWSWCLSRYYRRLGDAHRHFGNVYGNQRDYWFAIESYSRAAVLDPDYAQVYFSRGVLYWREIGNPYRAIQDLTRVLELDPAWTDAYFNRAMAHKMRREWDRAIADLESFLITGTDDFWCDAARRQLAEMRQELEEAAVLQTNRERRER